MGKIIKGNKNSLKIFTDNADEQTLEQLNTLLDQDCIKGNKIRIMPDCHAGKGCVIGTTMTILTGRVVPNLVGVDIGCGVSVYKLNVKDIDLKKLDEVINNTIPSGFNVHNSNDLYVDKYYNKFIFNSPTNIENAILSLGTLGGGNHFIEVDKDEDGHLYLVIHTGSRHLGVEICNYYQNLAYSLLSNDCFKENRYKIIEELKKNGKTSEIENALKELKENTPVINKELAYIEGKNFENYISDMYYAQQYASRNRQDIANVILKEMNLSYNIVDKFETVHNYIDTEHMILRKGAVSAQKGERLIIPMNMRDGSLLCIGKGNEDWNCSAPHGAGRIMSRTQAKKDIKIDDFKNAMEDIYSTSVCEETLDESPYAYKPMDEIIHCIEDTVTISKIIKPIYNFKAH